MYSRWGSIAGQDTCRSPVSTSSSEPLPHPLGPLRRRHRRPSRHEPRRLGRRQILAHRLAVHPQRVGHLGLGPARIPVDQDLGHVDHGEASPRHRLPSLSNTWSTARLFVTRTRPPGDTPHGVRRPHGEFRDRGGELRDRQTPTAGEFLDRRQLDRAPRASRALARAASRRSGVNVASAMTVSFTCSGVVIAPWSPPTDRARAPTRHQDRLSRSRSQHTTLHSARSATDPYVISEGAGPVNVQ